LNGGPAPAPVEFTEDRIPLAGIAETVEEMVELYGGEVTGSREDGRDFILPLRRSVAAAGGVECSLIWTAGEAGELVVTIRCNREVDAPRGQRIALLGAGVIGALLFTIWPFFPHAGTQLGALSWIGGAVALTVYFMTLRKTSGGIAYDFLQRVAARQRVAAEGGGATAPGG
jgi:hypothetical protein